MPLRWRDRWALASPSSTFARRPGVAAREAEVLRLTAPETTTTRSQVGCARVAGEGRGPRYRACGRACEAHAVHDRPAQAIVEARRAPAVATRISALARPSRGKPGMAFTSDTLSVLVSAGLPVLASSTG